LRLRDLERAALTRVLAEIAACGRRLLATARALAEIDVVTTLADVAVRRRYVRPVLSDGTELRIVNGRHPIVETSVSEAFVPNDTTMDAADAQILVITGPNMAGKSTYLRQVALIVLLAQIGSYVPADAARIGLVDRIFTRIGAQDDIATGQSTFMVEMTETAHILHSATGRSLLVLDELGRGTSTYDGMSIARSVIECIHSSPRLGCRTLFATHYHELTELAGILPRVRNYHVMVAEHGGQVVFQRKVVPGTADRSYGIHVAQMAGMPPSVVRRAQEVLTVLETHSDQVRARASSRPDVAQPRAVSAPVHPALDHLKAIQIDELTPLEALTKLYELQAMVEDDQG
jgi:DNA mismatch repair protein MutS